MSNYLSDAVSKLKGYKVNEISYKIKMDDNSSPYDLSNNLKNKLKEKLFDINYNRYPSSIHKNLLEKLSKLNNIEINNISLGNGSDEIIAYLLQMFFNKDDKILNLSPSFAMFTIVPQIMGIEIIDVPLIETENDWIIDKKSLDKILDKAKLIFIAMPNNPTGGNFNKEIILDIIKQNKCIVVIDEAYYDYNSFSYKEYINEFDNLIVMRTFSKSLGLAGCRLGYLISNKNIIEKYNSVRLPYNINTLSATVAEIVLDNFNEAKENFTKLFKNVKILFDELKKFQSLKLYKSNANFILLKTNEAEKIYNYCLEKKGIILKLFTTGILKNCLRITTGTLEENKILINTLKEIIN